MCINGCGKHITSKYEQFSSHLSKHVFFIQASSWLWQPLIIFCASSLRTYYSKSSCCYFSSFSNLQHFSFVIIIRQLIGSPRLLLFLHHNWYESGHNYHLCAAIYIYPSLSMKVTINIVWLTKQKDLNCKQRDKFQAYFKLCYWITYVTRWNNNLNWYLP